MMQTTNRNFTTPQAEDAGSVRGTSLVTSLLGRWGRRTALLCTALVLIMGASRGEAAETARSGRDAFLRAIAEVETGNNPRKVGRLGERGQYQFRQATWRQHTSQPFRSAHNPSVAHTVASQHYDWIIQQIERSGKRATPYMVAAAWNSGVGRVTSGRIPAASKDYAQRVVNLASCWSPVIRAASITGSAVSLASN